MANWLDNQARIRGVAQSSYKDTPRNFLKFLTDDVSIVFSLLEINCIIMFYLLKIAKTSQIATYYRSRATYPMTRNLF